MKQTIILLLLLVFAAGQAWAGPRLSMEGFVRLALANYPEYARMQSSYQEQRSLAERALSLKQLLLAVDTGYTFNHAANNASTNARFTVDATLSRSFPELAGINAQLSIGNRSILSPDVDPKQNPIIGLRLTLPLLKNALGRADRANLQQTQLTLKLIDHSEEEAFELILTRLAQQYYSWAVAAEKAAIYEGFQTRAQQYYNQVAQRFNLGIADQADLALAHQNLLSYQTSYLTAKNTAFENYCLIVAQIEGTNYRPDLLLPRPVSADDAVGEYYSPDTNLPALRADAISFLTNTPSADTNAHDEFVDSLRILQIARINLELAALDVLLADSRALPNLNFTLSGEKSAGKKTLGEALGAMDGSAFFAGLSLSVPLQNSSEKFASEAAKSALAKQRLDYDATRITGKNALQQYVISLATARDIVKFAEQSVEAAATRVNVIYTKFQQGRSTLNNLTDAQDAWARARITALDSLYSLRRLELEYSALTDRLAANVLPR